MCACVCRPVAFDTTLRLRRPAILSDDCPDVGRGGVAEYQLVATVSHHGKHAAGERFWGARHAWGSGQAWAPRYTLTCADLSLCTPWGAGGHYTADVQQPDGQWLRFNDTAVDLVPEDAVLREQPYMLFYSRAHGSAAHQ